MKDAEKIKAAQKLKEEVKNRAKEERIEKEKKDKAKKLKEAEKEKLRKEEARKLKEAEKINEAKKEKLRNEREIEAKKARLEDHNESDNQEDLEEGEISTHDVTKKMCESEIESSFDMFQPTPQKKRKREVKSKRFKEVFGEESSDEEYDKRRPSGTVNHKKDILLILGL